MVEQRARRMPLPGTTGRPRHRQESPAVPHVPLRLLTSEDALFLQHTVGNRVVAQLVSDGGSPVVQRRTKQPSVEVQPLLAIKPGNRWNDKQLAQLIESTSVPITQALAYVGRTVGVDRRLVALDLGFAFRAYDDAIDRIVSGAAELTRYGVESRELEPVVPYFQGLKERKQRIEQALMALYSSDAGLAASPTVNAPEKGWGNSPPASLLKGTQQIGDYDRRRLTKTLRPDQTPSIWGDVAAGKPGELPKFQSVIPGVKEDFRTRVRASAELMIREYTKVYVTGKGTADRADVTPWARYQEIANAAKGSVDASFGAFAQRPAFVAGKNLQDVWEKVGKEQAKLEGWLRKPSAQGVLGGLASSWSQLTRIKQEHHALPDRSPEQGILTSVLDSVAGSHVSELLAIDRGWPATQDHETHSVNIQRWKVKAPGDAAQKGQRTAFWDVFQTIMHEYIHSLADSRYTTYAGKQPGDIYKILIEGVTSMLTEVAYANVDPSGALLRSSVEGPDLAALPFSADTVPDIRGQRYDQYSNALNLVGVVGMPNLYAAYFLGKTDLIKHSTAR